MQPHTVLQCSAETWLLQEQTLSSSRVFSLLTEVFNAAANNLVTIRQCPETSHMAGLAEVSGGSLPTAHYMVMEAGSLCFP